MRFELTRAKPSRFLIYRLNHSATLSDAYEGNVSKEDYIPRIYHYYLGARGLGFDSRINPFPLFFCCVFL